MYLRYWLIAFILGIVLISGCTQKSEVTTTSILVCNKPYILVGNDCCLDENDDGICDKDKPITTTIEVTTTPTTTVPTTSLERPTTTISVPTTSRPTTSTRWKFTAEDEITAVRMSDSGRYTVVGSKDGNAYMLSRDGKLGWKRPSGEGVTSLAMTPDGSYIGIGFDSISDCGNTFYLLRHDNERLWALNDRSEYCYGQIDEISIVPTSSYIVMGTSKKKVIVVDKNGSQLWELAIGTEIGGLSATGNQNAVIGLLSDYVYHFDNNVVLWEFKADDNINKVVSTISGSYTVIASKDNTVYLLDSSGNLLWKYSTGDKVNAVAITPDGDYIAAGSSDKNVYLFDRSGAVLFKYQTTWDVLDVAISFNGEYVVAGARDKNIYLINGEGDLLWSYPTEGTVVDVEITPDAGYIVGGSSDGSTYFFDGPGTSDRYIKKDINCYSRFDCGDDEEVYFCKGDDIARGNRRYFCYNPGTEKAVCSARTSLVDIVGICSGSSLSCVDGKDKCKRI